MKSAVITGPTGSIGTALIEHLISNRGLGNCKTRFEKN